MRFKALIFRHALLSLAFLLLFLALNAPQVIVLSQLGAVAWYPATGLCLALMLGISPWYAIAVAFANTLAGALIYQQPLQTYGETLGAVGMAICYGGAAYILRGPLAIDPGLPRRRDVSRYLLVTVTAAMGATVVGVACLAADKTIAWNGVWRTSEIWFLGDAIGLVGVAPFFLIHVLPWVRQQVSPDQPAPHALAESHEKTNFTFSPAQALEALGQAVALPVVLWAVFGPHLRDRELTYLCLVPIIWIAMRQGIRRVVTGLLALNFGIALAMHVYPPTHELLGRLGLLMLVVSAVGLIAGSAVTERLRAAQELHEQTVYLNSLIENSPLGLAVLDRNGRTELTNPAFKELFLYDPSDLEGSSLDKMFVPQDEPSESRDLIPQVLAGQHLHLRVRRRRKDGEILNVEVHAVPLVVQGRVQGAYTIYNDISEQIKASEAERKHAESLSRLVSELQLRTRQMGLLNDMGSLLECCVETKEACSVVSVSVQKLFPEAVSGALYLFKASRNLLGSAGRWGKASSAEPIFAPDACWSLRTGRPHWSDNSADAIRCPHLPKDLGGMSLCVPMVAQGDTLGILQLDFDENNVPVENSGPESLRDSRQGLATAVSGQVALSLASLRLRETLRDQSIRDSLTGLFNRRFMEESLERELLRAGRKRHSLSVLFLDLDHFKRFNDTFGHDAGDFVLRSIADLLRNFFRSDDVCCRYGGEEFGIILPEASVEQAAIRAQALREQVKMLKLEHRNHALGVVTLSIGIAGFPEHAATAEQLLRLADQSLYRSKAAGRDTVTAAPRS